MADVPSAHTEQERDSIKLRAKLILFICIETDLACKHTATDDRFSCKVTCDIEDELRYTMSSSGSTTPNRMATLYDQFHQI